MPQNDTVDSHDEPALTGDSIPETTFTTVRFKPGYDEREVDEFLDRVTAQLELQADQRSMTWENVHEEEFTATRWWEPGYLRDEVDAFVDLLAAQLRHDRRRGGH